MLQTAVANIVATPINKWEDIEYERGAILTPSPTGSLSYLNCDCVYLRLDVAHEEYDSNNHVLIPTANNKVSYYNSEDHIIVVETSDLGKDFIVPADDEDQVEVWDEFFR